MGLGMRDRGAFYAIKRRLVSLDLYGCDACSEAALGGGVMIDYKERDQSMEMICEECTSNEFFDGSWQSCINQAKAASWFVKKITGAWLHFCSQACFDRWTKKNMGDK